MQVDDQMLVIIVPELRPPGEGAGKANTNARLVLDGLNPVMPIYAPELSNANLLNLNRKISCFLQVLRNFRFLVLAENSPRVSWLVVVHLKGKFPPVEYECFDCVQVARAD